MRDVAWHVRLCETLRNVRGFVKGHVHRWASIYSVEPDVISGLSCQGETMDGHRGSTIKKHYKDACRGFCGLKLQTHESQRHSRMSIKPRRGQSGHVSFGRAPNQMHVTHALLAHTYAPQSDVTSASEAAKLHLQSAAHVRFDAHDI